MSTTAERTDVRTARREAIRAAIEANPTETNTAIAKRFQASRDLVIEVRRQHAGTLVMSRYEAMCKAITLCAETDEVKDIRDKARALEVYTQQAQNREAEEKAREIRLRAERRGGEIMLTQIKAAGARGNPGGRGAKIVPSDDARAHQPPTLREQGISYQQASDWQHIARIPKQTFEAALTDPVTKPTTKSLVDLAKGVPTTTANGSTTLDPLALWVWGRACDFERKEIAGREPADVFGGMTATQQQDMQRIVPMMLAWYARLPISGDER